jgi:hypothetical protein
MPAIPQSAYVLALLQAGLDVIQNLGVAGSSYDRRKVATFQVVWNRAVAAGALAGSAAPNQNITTDGLWGPETAAAMGHTLPSGIPLPPSIARLVPQWWTPIKSGVLGAAAQLQNQLAQQVGQAVPDTTGSTGPQRAQDVLNSVLDPSQTIAQSAQAATPLPGNTALPIQLPGSLIQGQAPARQASAWPWVVGGLTLATLIAGFAWAASKSKKRGRR